MRETDQSPKAAEEATAQGTDLARNSPVIEASPEGVEPATLPAQDPAELAAAWDALCAEIRSRIQPELFETWFRRAALVELREDTVAIAVQNAFARDWLERYHRGVIEESAQASLGRPAAVELRVDPELALPPREHEEPEAPAVERSAPAALVQQGSGPSARGPRDFSTALVRGSDVGLNAKYTFENFVVGPCNRFAHAASVGAAESPGAAYNPLFLHGNVGLGKTHLLQSLCFSLLENWEGVRILYLSCETFVNHFIGALENGDLQAFRNKYRGVDVLVVDDIHLLANKERTQEEFFHTFNTLYNAGKQIVLSSDSPPKDIPTLQERLVSRFKWGLVTALEAPCYETRVAILKRKARERGRDLPADVAGLLAERIDNNIRELEGAVTKLFGYADLSGEAVSVDLAHIALRDTFTVRRGGPTLDDIVSVVTDEFPVKLSDLQSRRRTATIAFPRQVAMFLARRITRHSLEEVGGFFGGRDHSTVLYAVTKISGLLEREPETADLLSRLLERLGERPL
jgi:chromosomal replication initiator protein